MNVDDLLVEYIQGHEPPLGLTPNEVHHTAQRLVEVSDEIEAELRQVQSHVMHARHHVPKVSRMTRGPGVDLMHRSVLRRRITTHTPDEHTWR